MILPSSEYLADTASTPRISFSYRSSCWKRHYVGICTRTSVVSTCFYFSDNTYVLAVAYPLDRLYLTLRKAFPAGQRRATFPS